MISPRSTARIMAAAFALFILFHLLVLAGVVPASIVWGGRAGESIVALELTSIALLLLFAAIAWARGHASRPRLWRLLGFGCWVMALFFALNTLGNLLAESRTETVLFTPLTLLFALGAIRLALAPKPSAVDASIPPEA